MTKEELKSRYAAQAQELTAVIRRRRSRNTGFIVGELVSFLGVIGSLVMVAVSDCSNVYAGTAVALVAVYVFVRKMDVRNSAETERLESQRAVCIHEMQYLDGDYRAFGDGKVYIDPHHAFSFDLDLFGPQSLFHRMNRTVTTGGSDCLAALLGKVEPDAPATIDRHREAVRELAGAEELRTRWMTMGQRGVLDTQTVLQLLHEVQSVRLPLFALSPSVRAMAVLSVIGFFVTLAASVLGVLPGSFSTLWGLLHLVVMLLSCERPMRTIQVMIGKIHRQMKVYVELMEIISTARLSAKENAELLARLSGRERDAVQAFRSLASLLDDIDRRGNSVYMAVCNVLFLHDLFLVRRFLQWKTRYFGQLADWIAVVSRFDARVSMATFCYNEPDAVDPELTDALMLVYEAEGLYHPFLGTKAVRNDFCLQSRHYYIVTGANMAGKSTFLRSLGVNYVLALCGLPVFARRLKVSVCSLFSSMRTTDDLTHGISYFNAELLRLQQLIGECRKNRHTLIILDEILKGTNSVDKLNGSRKFLEAISTLPVTGVVATHDLELSKMADARPDRFHNYCFEIGLAEQVSYTYKITPGVARNQNATYLLQRILQEVLG